MGQVISRKTDLLPRLAKKRDKLGAIIRVCRTQFFVFYTEHLKYRFTAKLDHEHVEHESVHAKFLFEFFHIFKCVF
jgi:hypothetical protein